jgi:deoxyribodipyrimidine photo-lyase
VPPPAIMWFRQDLRVSDNRALAAAVSAGPVLPLYVLDDEAPGQWRRGGASRVALFDALLRLERELRARGAARLFLMRGRTVEILERVATLGQVRAIHCTREFNPWSSDLETAVGQLCARRGWDFAAHPGALLHDPASLRTKAGGAFRVFTPFARAIREQVRIPQPREEPGQLQFWTGEIVSEAAGELLPEAGTSWGRKLLRAWRERSPPQQRLSDFVETGLGSYAERRDRPDLEATSGLSAALHFGEISPAQCWHATERAVMTQGQNLRRGADKFLDELLWREFSYHLLAHAPHLPDACLRTEFASFPWRKDPAALDAWRRGETGYPLVDAGMRQLWATGFMHNRVRMATASFLVKHLLVSWTDGERWFWDTLADADLANNAASWQWVAGCGADAAPFFRIFNPVLQGEKFDPQGLFVRRWLPELADVPAPFIHRPWSAPPDVMRKAGVALGTTYPAPIIDHGRARLRALEAFASIGHS